MLVSNARTGYVLSLAAAEDMIQAFEGFSPVPYRCSAERWTIGYGSTFYEDGVYVRPADEPITRTRAKRLMLHHLRCTFLPGVVRMSPCLWRHQNRLCAVLSFAYNLGLGAYQTSTLRRMINDGDWIGAANQFPRWRYAGGRVERGLVRRRQAERDLFSIDLEP